MGQTLSFASTYELKLKPSLFTYDNKTETDTHVEISDDHNAEKISSYISGNGFKTAVTKITKVSVNDSDGAAVYLTFAFDQSNISYNADDNAVTIIGKWTQGTKQNKKSIKRAKSAAVNAKRGTADEHDENKDVGSDDELDIKVSDVLTEIKNKLHREAYLESEISRQHLYICFSDDVDMCKI